MLKDWEAGLVGNNPGTVARLPRKASAAKVVINLVRRRFTPPMRRSELPSAA